jgi:hypothetical protein
MRFGGMQGRKNEPEGAGEVARHRRFLKVEFLPFFLP